MVDFQSTVVTDQKLVLSNREGHRLGPDLVLRDCEVTVDCAEKWLNVTRTTFESCVITISRKLTNYAWFGARFLDCTFRGDLVGLRFGCLPDEELDDYGAVSSCSFADSVLHLTDFLNVDMSTLRLPSWPCFTVPNPATRADLLDMEWPGRVRLLMEVFVESWEDTSAGTAHAPDVVKQYGGDLPTLKRLLENASGVIL